LRIAYLDVFCGLSGDMFLGALVDAGVSLDALVAELERLPLEGWEVTAQTVRKAGLRATKVDVEEHHHHHDHDHGREHHHRDHQHGMSADDIIAIMRAGSLRPDLVERAVGVVEVIAEAEAQAHGVPREQVHFHELGGLDTVIDVCGAVIGLDLLGIEKLYCSPLPVSHGYVDTAHGRLPVPPPAVANLLQGVPTYPLDIEGETVTPTGAAIAVALAEVGPRPAMTVMATGLGAGTKDFPIANLVRLFVGEAVEGPRFSRPPEHSIAGMGPAEARPLQMVLLEANLDDMSGEFFGYAMDKLFAAGAVDVWATPIFMKKNRPAMMLSALAHADQADAVGEAILMHTTSFGVRRQMVQRDCLDREHVTVATPYGPIRVKVGKRDGRVLTAAPEYEDCAAAANQAGVSLKDVYAAALAARGA
jgi:pyridinium-3,5-bisthiocarboxylic acid mononucleotide nickel chelatase